MLLCMQESHRARCPRMHSRWQRWWISAFPETFTSLTSLNLTNFSNDVNFGDLERLVAKCERLEKLKLNRGITLDQLRRLLLLRGPCLKELGIGSFVQDVDGKGMYQIASLFESCKSVRALSGLWEVVPQFLPLMFPLCRNLRNLNLSDSTIASLDFVRLISQCHLLECLWVRFAFFLSICQKSMVVAS